MNISEQKNVHCELPWSITTIEGYPEIAWVTSESDGRMFCMGDWSDAEFVITACNEHYDNKKLIGELANQLEAVVSLMDKWAPKHYVPESETWENIEEVENARAALAKARGDA